MDRYEYEPCNDDDLVMYRSRPRQKERAEFRRRVRNGLQIM